MAIPDRDFGHLESSDGRMCGYVDRFGVERDMSGAAIAPGSRPAPGTLGAPVIGVLARGVAVVVGQSAVPASVTGTLSETTLATIAIPAGAMGVNGSLRVTTKWSMPNNANTKTMFVRLGGTILGINVGVTTTTAYNAVTMIQNRGAGNSQIGTNGGGIGNITGQPTATIDTTIAQNLTITGQLGVGTDTLTLEGYTVEILNP